MTWKLAKQEAFDRLCLYEANGPMFSTGAAASGLEPLSLDEADDTISLVMMTAFHIFPILCL